MLFYSSMCFSSSIICLLIVTSHGSVVPGHQEEEHGGTGTSTHHQHNDQSSSTGLKNLVNSSHHRTHQKDLTLNNYLTYPTSDSSAENSKTTHRKERSADVADQVNQLPSQASAKSSSADPSQPPLRQGSSSHSQQNHSDQFPKSQTGLQPPKFRDRTSRKKVSHHNHEHHGEHDHDEHSHGEHDDHGNHGEHDDHSNHGEHDDHGNHEEHDDHGNHGGHDDHDDDHDPKELGNFDDHGHDCHDQNHNNSSAERHQHPSSKMKRHISGGVWLRSSFAVVIISFCGLLSVAVIPIMQKWFYHPLLQFLVGLAVGSLSGDGLLHLMPHAILGGEESHDHNSHNHDSETVESIEKTAIWRGFAALAGIFLFFIAERLLGVLTAHKRQKKEEKSRHSKSMIPVMQREDGANNGNVGEKLAQPKKNSYDHIREKDEKETIQMLQQEGTPSRKGSIQSTHEVGFHGRSSFSLDPEMSVAYRPDSESSVIVSDHHGHSHGHSHDLPHSISAVAWMVIMGDGLHNFCDGLAIGAAFASSDADGVSTTVAVFCHELPHELGDFAMLLKTGMSVKQALFYNGLSSILCFVGMIIGVFLGNVNSATSWVFAGTAGMFLYISLVDMLPELTTGNESGLAAVSTLAIQVIGISIGICIMLLIALYEHKLSAMIS